jgi:hydrogenase nickel incorporation protein HypA/HybF
MHEMGIAEGILASAVDAARDAGATRINAVDISVGELTQVVEDALHFAWEVLREGSMAEQAVLNVTVIPARSHCLECGAEYGHSMHDGTRCPTCGSYIVQLVTGRELKIDTIDID